MNCYITSIARYEKIPGSRFLTLSAFFFVIVRSRIYQNITPTSDYDFIVVIEDGVLPVPDVLQLKLYGSNSIDKRFIVLEEGLINCTLISFYDWRVCLLQHHHECLEVLFTDPSLYLFIAEKIRRLHSAFVIDLDLLRRTAAWESKRRYTRAVFPARDSMRRGKKDMVHAFRYLLFAMQIFEYGRIIDFTCANDYYRQIVLGTEHVQTEEDFKALLIEWEPERSKLSHQLGDARKSRRFYGRLDTEKRFLLDARARDLYYEHELDAVPLRGEVTPDPLPARNNDIDADQSFQLIRETLTATSTSLNALQDALVPIVWLRSQHSPETLILTPQRVQRLPSTPFIKAIRNGVVLQQSKLPDAEGRHRFRLLSLSMPSIPNPRTLTPEGHNEWNRRLSSTNASEMYIAEEHLDGTHVTLFLDEGGAWKLSSRIEPLDPTMTLSYVPINNVDYEIKLTDAFWKVWNAKGHRLPSIETHGHLCFTFNLIYFEHRQIVCYNYEDAFLVHIRDMRNGHVLDHRQFGKEMSWSLPQLYAGAGLPSSLNAFEKIVFDENPLVNKGYIIKPNLAVNQEPWAAVAIKNPIYMSICYGTDSTRIGQLNMRVEVDRKMLLDMTLDGSSHRFVAYYPIWKPYFERVATVFYEMCDFIDGEYHKYRRQPRKELVNGIANFPFKHAIFNLKKFCYPGLSEHFALNDPKGLFVAKPWRQYVHKRHRDVFDWLHGDDNIRIPDDSNTS